MSVYGHTLAALMIARDILARHGALDERLHPKARTMREIIDDALGVPAPAREGSQKRVLRAPPLLPGQGR